MLALLVVAVVSIAAGALLGRALMRREIEPVLRTAAYSSGRANRASAVVENIAADWPAVVAQSEKADEIARRALRETQAAAKAAATAARQTELEQAIAQMFSITLTKQ